MCFQTSIIYPDLLDFHCVLVVVGYKKVLFLFHIWEEKTKKSQVFSLLCIVIRWSWKYPDRNSFDQLYAFHFLKMIKNWHSVKDWEAGWSVSRTWEICGCLKQCESNQCYGRSYGQRPNETKQKANQTSEADENLKQCRYHDSSLDLQRQFNKPHVYLEQGR